MKNAIAEWLCSELDDFDLWMDASLELRRMSDPVPDDLVLNMLQKLRSVSEDTVLWARQAHVYKALLRKDMNAQNPAIREELHFIQRMSEKALHTLPGESKFVAAGEGLDLINTIFEKLEAGCPV